MIEAVTRVIVEYFNHAGESVTSDVADRDIQKLNIPTDAVCFRFFNLVTQQVTPNTRNVSDVEARTLKLREVIEETSPMHYVRGEFLSLTLAQERCLEASDLSSYLNDLKKKKCENVVVYKGVIYPFWKNDIYVPINRR